MLRHYRKLVISPDGTKAYVMNGFAIFVIDTATDTISNTIPLGREGYYGDLAMHPDGSRIYVTDWLSRTIAVINTANSQFLHNISLGNLSQNSPSAIAVSPDGSKAYVVTTGEERPALWVIDLATNTVLDSIQMNFLSDGHFVRDAQAVAVNPDGFRVYVANSGSDLVSVFDAITNRVLATIPVGDYLWGNTDDFPLGFAFVDASKPTPSSQLIATAFSASHIHLSWQDSSINEKGFIIERKNGKDGNYSLIVVTGENVSNYSNNDLRAGTYCYRVKAFNAAGESSYSNEVCVNTIGANIGGSFAQTKVTCREGKKPKYQIDSRLIIRNTGLLEVTSNQLFAVNYFLGGLDAPLLSTTINKRIRVGKPISISQKFDLTSCPQGQVLMAMLDAENSISEQNEADNMVISNPLSLVQVRKTQLQRPLGVKTVKAQLVATTQGNHIRFFAEGTGIAWMQVEVFTLAGTKIFNDSVAGSELAWHLQDGHEQAVANGVYLYLVTAKDHRGVKIPSGLKKLIVRST